ncbi:hypothetical protein [Nonomuraea basaltis]|uniref:hypothetical protein n=1 Tax=Nonomuraea basaltis TaxID=2495887 RepID=UPI00110C7078|nr:hypothetical protein [Nonomuraea basaltis]TMR97995.1 hypothetical protein EJK15_15190 [Nonomuraea basaltis]
MVVVIASSLSGCKYMWWSEEDCRQEASKQVADLKRAVSQYLPEPIGAALEGQDGCDSGDEGGWLSATVDRTADVEGIIGRFTAQGWTRIELQPTACNVKCIAGVSGRWNERVIEVVIGETQNDEYLEVTAEFVNL